MGIRRRATTTAWVQSTYFAEGLPYMLVRWMAQAFFTDRGAREAYLGYLNLLGIPWNLKFIWAPLVDYLGTKRRWLVVVEATLTIAVLALAGLAWAAAPGAPPSEIARLFRAMVWLLALLAFLAATHDIAIDSFYLAVLPDRTEQALYTGDRVTAYRIAVIYVKSLLVWVASLLGWASAWGMAAITMALLFVGHALLLQEPESSLPVDRKREQPPLLRHFARAFGTYLAQPRIVVVLAFIVTYKLGDEIMVSMNTPFLLRELGVTKMQLAWLSGILGTVGTIVGSMLSAWCIARLGLRRAIWPLTLLMNVNIWAYVALAAWRPDPRTAEGIGWIAGIHTYEMLAAGLGNSVLVVYLMRTCRTEFKAAHYAIGSALMSLGGTVLGGFGGILVEQIGYVGLYVSSFALAIPGMLLIPWIPYLGQGSPSADSETA